MPIAPHLNDPEYWRRRAKKARAHAKQMTNERHKKMLFEIAKEYDDGPAKRFSWR